MSTGGWTLAKEVIVGVTPGKHLEPANGAHKDNISTRCYEFCWDMRMFDVFISVVTFDFGVPWKPAKEVQYVYPLNIYHSY